jgi:hypothetical protein
MWENYVEEEAGEAEPVDGLSSALSFLSLSHNIKIRMTFLMF